MTRDETIALFLKGKDAWNAWAEDMLAQRKALEDSGQWLISPGNSVEPAPSNPETANWLELAGADFSNIEMTGKERPNSPKVRRSTTVSGADFYELNMDHIDFSRFIFPANASFENATFHIATYFSGCQFYGSSNFVRTKFPSYVTFHSAIFFGFCSFYKASIDGADFSNVVFHRSAKFQSAFLRVSSGFRNCVFHSTAQFSRCYFANTDFGRASFFGPTSFSESQFHKGALFRRAIFHNGTHFKRAVFHGLTSFFEANFKKSVSFVEAKFEKNVSFEAFSIRNEARFQRVLFEGNANFTNCFIGGLTNFSFVRFNDGVVFSMSKFLGDCYFNSIRSDNSFLLRGVRFAQVPSFAEAVFHSAPVLDDIEVQSPMAYRLWNQLFNVSETLAPRTYIQCFEVARLPDDYQKFRVLRKLATETGDHQQEMEFFAQETMCRRFWKDKPFSGGAGRFWFGWLYEKTSDFGRSFARPFVALLLTWAAFSYLYAILKTNTFDLVQAAYISVRHSLLISGLSKTSTLDTAITTLYGDTIPTGVAWLMVFQPFICVIWFFLFALALRNHFRIK